MSTWNLSAVPESQVPVPDFYLRSLTFQVPQNARFAAQPALRLLTVQCTSIYALIDTCIVPEVPAFVVNRELVRENSKIIGILFAFSYFYKLLSIAEKGRNFRDRIISLTFHAGKGW